MTTLSTDPLAAVVRLRIEDLRREATADRLARSVSRSGRQYHPWPTTVVAALRDSLVHPFSRPVRSSADCVTCA